MLLLIIFVVIYFIYIHVPTLDAAARTDGVVYWIIWIGVNSLLSVWRRSTDVNFTDSVDDSDRLLFILNNLD